MTFLHPSGAWALLGLLVVILLYMLRRRYVEVKIPSTYLWRRARADQTATQPLQKIQRNLLLLLRLIGALLIAFALMRPMGSGGIGSDVMLIFDLSASMRAADGSTSRIEIAKQEASHMIAGMGIGKISIMTAGIETRQLLSRSENKEEALGIVEGIHAETGTADLTSALSLSQALRREFPDLNVIVFSDSYQPQQDIDALLIATGRGADNRAILSFIADQKPDGGRAVCRIANYGVAQEISVECYADDRLCDMRSVYAQDGETVSVTFDLPLNVSIIRAVLVDGDALREDDERYAVVKSGAQARVILAGQSNVFLEKALSLRNDITLLKSTPDEAARTANADLYIFDGELPQTLPESGALLLFNPPESLPGISVAESKSPERPISLAPGAFAETITAGMTLEGVALRAYRPLAGANPLLLCGTDVVAVAGENDGRRFAVVGFDLHDSNLPLKYDFPVLMQNLLSYLMPDIALGMPDVNCGDTISVPLSALAVKAEVATPSGRVVPLAPPFPALPLNDTAEVGLYTALQTLPDGQTKTLKFSAHIPLAESDVRTVAVSSDENERSLRAGETAYTREWTPWIIAALIALLMLEWWVRCREY